MGGGRITTEGSLSRANAVEGIIDAVCGDNREVCPVGSNCSLQA